VATSEDILRQQLELSTPQALRSDSSSYELAAQQAKQFHGAGLPSAKLSHYLKPDALTYLPEDTFNLPEDVYHNLSGHERRKLGERNKNLIPD
ncbi:VC2046/SO_2500 family protein, partial [Streptococcus suis]